MKKIFFLPIIAYLPLIILLIIIGGLWWLRSRLQDDSVPLVEDFHGEKVMFIFPHPDDEVTCAGMLKYLDSLGNETILLTLTHGEAGDSNGLINESNPLEKKIKLGQLRKKELLKVGQLLGIDHLEILDFPDSGIKNTSPDLLKKVIQEKIAYYQPTLVITYDDKVGLYGHPDHYLTARYMKEIFLNQRNKPEFSVKKLYQVTLPKPMIETVLQFSESLRQQYPTLAENGLPNPTIAVKITEFGKEKQEAMLLHQSQRPTFDTMQPYFDKVPPFIYFRLFDKEYFTQIK